MIDKTIRALPQPPLTVEDELQYEEEMAPFLDALPGVAEDINALAIQANELAQSVNAAAATAIAEADKALAYKTMSGESSESANLAATRAADSATGASAFAQTATIKAAEAVISAANAKTYATNSGVMPAMRDTLGVFPGVIRPALNLFCGDAVTDVAPIGTFSRSTGGYRLGPTGLYEWVEAELVRREWSANGDFLGWLIEEQRTNHVPQYSYFTNAAWIKAATAPVITTGELDLFGGSTGQTIAKDVSSDVLVRNLITLASDTGPICSSYYIKKKAGGLYWLEMHDANDYAVRIGVTYDAATESITETHGAIISSQVDDGPVGYKIVTFVFNNINKSLWSVDIWTLRVSLPDIFNAVQVERGLFRTSLIPTTATAVTRPADVWTVPVSSFQFNPLESAVYVATRTAFGLASSGISQVLFMLDDGSFTNAILVFRDATGTMYAMTYSSGVPYQMTVGVIANNADIKLIMCFKESSFRVCLNGGTVLSLPCVRPSGFTTLRVCSDPFGALSWNSAVSQVSVFQREMSNNIMKYTTAWGL